MKCLGVYGIMTAFLFREIKVNIKKEQIRHSEVNSIIFLLLPSLLCDAAQMLREVVSSNSTHLHAEMIKNIRYQN